MVPNLQMDLEDAIDRATQKAGQLRTDYDAVVVALWEIAKSVDGPERMREIAVTALVEHGDA